MADKILKVKWLVADKRLIKFVDVEDSYNIAEGVDITGIKNGKTFVTMELKDNIVVKLNKQDVKEETKKDEHPKVEKPEDKSSEEKTPVDERPPETEPEECPVDEAKVQPLNWTISAISYDKGVVRFEEQETAKYWYVMAPKAKEAFKGLKNGDSIQVVIGTVDATNKDGEPYTKDGIVLAKVVTKKEETKEPKKEQVSDKPVEEGTKEAYTSSTGNSIERQVALKEAGAIIRSLIEAGAENVNSEDKINKLLSSFTKGSLDALRNA